jgi:pyruvate dehydrogenase E2 component (dihydrolipoamide acetyltransferase)
VTPGRRERRRAGSASRARRPTVVGDAASEQVLSVSVVVMPRLSPAMEEATIVAWLVEDGGAVAAGQPFVEIEADKAATALAVDADGVLRIAAAPGAIVAPGAVIARVDGAPAPVPEPRPVACRVRPRVDQAPVAAPEVRRPATSLERVVARRMTQSRREIPTFEVAVDVDLHALHRLRADMRKAGVSGDAGRVPSVNDLLVRAAAVALRDHPRVNSRWEDGEIVDPGRIDVGCAVATDDGGLVVPVLRGADRLPLAALAAEARELTARARKGELTADELAAATFSVSNLGMLGVTRFGAIVSPGQGAILAVGAAVERYVPVDGEPVLRPIATLTLSCDHRVVYGAHAAAFLERVRTLLEHPGALAL